jgi:tetraacyldisaccharide 4'-kinase
MVKSKNILLYPVSLIYGLITGIRNFLYNTGILPSVEFNIPVICVGNITVGGPGKTPHTEYLTELLRQNFRVATLSRGYKRKTRDFRVAGASSLVSEIGDEPLQIFKKFQDVLVTVDRNRVHGVRKILHDRPETDVIILDDGFQHRRITPGFSILLSDFDRLLVRDHLLPYGNLRENLINMRRADIILITKSPEGITPIRRRLIVKEIDKAPYQNLYFTSLTYKDPLPVFEGNPTEESYPGPLYYEGCGIVLVTGIANPLPLKEYLLKTAAEMVHLSFPDHYNFEETDIMMMITAWHDLKSAVKYVFTTEKDAVRLREFTNIAEPVRSALYYIPVGIHFLNDDKDEFDNMIVEYVRKNKRNNRFSEGKWYKKS